MAMIAADVRSRDELAGLVAAGGRPEYLFFWGHQPQADGSIGQSCLSQWWPPEFTVDGVTYATAEHFMMRAKALLFGDREIADRVLAASHPGEAKELGRQVRGFDEQAWAGRRFDLVVAGNVAKFGQNAALRQFLVGTGDSVLVEASPATASGASAWARPASSPEHWCGLNLLGFALMAARHQFAVA